MDCTVISIGALAANHLWNERTPARTGHATTALVRTKGAGGSSALILVDPGLPEPALVARLRERTGLGPESITHVFLTTFHPETRRAITAFPDAVWLISPREREWAGVPLAQSLGRLAETQRAAEAAGEELDEDQATMLEVLRRDVAILQRCKPSPDTIAEGVDVFPLPGVTPGCTGLLLSGRETTLICGDAVATAEHVEQGKVLPNCEDREQAKESFVEAIEIADLLVPGRDNLLVNPTKKPF
ncbi:MAG: MBL fold metallo-hydrolase [Phycisphaeraceae bacterium]|nr:MAG: MBL fold metallo-hydrolase [Phycisphaeraceae bacterium]